MFATKLFPTFIIYALLQWSDLHLHCLYSNPTLFEKIVISFSVPLSWDKSPLTEPTKAEQSFNVSILRENILYLNT